MNLEALKEPIQAPSRLCKVGNLLDELGDIDPAAPTWLEDKLKTMSPEKLAIHLRDDVQVPDSPSVGTIRLHRNGECACS